MKLIFSSLLLLFITGYAAGKISGDNIQTLKNNIVLLKTDLYNKNIPSISIINETDAVVSELDNEELLKNYSYFKDLYKSNPAADTLLYALNIFSYQFFNDYADKLYPEFMESGKNKIIIFSTRMSCECTMRQSAEFEQAMYTAYTNNPSEFDFLLVDFMTDETIQNNYDISFIPAMIIMDKENKELTRFAAEDDILEKLTNYLSIREIK
jgi:hypothetical protein